jgi:hypothetical protein
VAVVDCRRDVAEPSIHVRCKRSQARCGRGQCFDESPHGDRVTFITLGARGSLLQQACDVAKAVDWRKAGGVRASASGGPATPSHFETVEQALEPDDALRKIV